MKAQNQKDWDLPIQLSAYAIHTSSVNLDKGNLMKEVLAIKDVTDCRFNPGNWLTPLYLIGENEEQRKDIEELLDLTGFVWSYVAKTQALYA